MTSSRTEQGESEPRFRVVKGTPTDEELAALVVVLAARSSTSAEPAAVKPSGWSAYARTVRRLPLPGPGAWQRSARPG